MNRRRVAATALCAAFIFAGSGRPAVPSPSATLSAAQVMTAARGTTIDPAIAPATSTSTTGTVVVELAGVPVALRAASARAVGRTLAPYEETLIRIRLRSAQAALAPQIVAAGGTITGRFLDAIDGIKVRIDLGSVGALAALPGVVAVRSVGVFAPANVHAVPYTGVPSVWQDTGKTGLGVRIAIIDSGIDYYHADFGGSGDPADFSGADGTTLADGGFPNAKVVGGYDLVGDDYDASGVDGSSTPHPDPDPLDCEGHGTHVAGTAAGLGVLADGTAYSGPYNATTVSGHDWTIGPGVAPGASLLAYRVFGCAGSTDMVVDAIDRAVRDGVDVINLSLNAPLGNDDSAEARAVDVAAQAGIVVSAASGGPSTAGGPSSWWIGSPGGATGAITSSATDAAVFPRAYITLGSSQIYAANENDATLPLTGVLEPLLTAPTELSRGCEAPDWAGFTAGRIAVVAEGANAIPRDCTFEDKGARAEAAGAIGVIVIATEDDTDILACGFCHGYIGPSARFTIPLIATENFNGPTFVAAVGEPVDIVATDLAIRDQFESGYQTTFGPDGPRGGDDALKPDVAAPGRYIVSALAGSGSRAVTMSGPSMAAAYTSGVAALLVQAHPDWSPAQVKAAIMNTTVVAPGEHGIELYDPMAAGAGLIQPRQAIDTTTLITTGPGQASLSFGYDPRLGAYSASRTMTIWNDSAHAIAYRLSGSLNRNSGEVSHGETLTISPTLLTVPAHSHRTVSVRLALTAARMAALPGVEAYRAPLLASIRGYVRAVPTVAGPGRHVLHVPFLAVPRSLSAVGATAHGPYTVAGGTAATTTHLTNTGTHIGSVDVFQWFGSDPVDAIDGIDIRAAGVQTKAVSWLAPSDRDVAFAVNVYGRWSNPFEAAVQVLVDANGDGVADFSLRQAPYVGALASEVVDLSDDSIVGDGGDLRDPGDGSIAVLDAPASALGLVDGSGPFAFKVRVDRAGGPADETSWFTFDPFHPTVSSGHSTPLSPGASRTVPLIVDLAENAAAPALGWLIVTTDDANGAAQADEIPIGALPGP